MRNEFTAIIHRDGDWYWAYCPEVPGANGQGRTLEDVRQDLAEAIDLMLEVMREEGLAEAPPGSRRETVTIE